MSTRRLVQTFEAWRHDGEPMVLATVYDTIGSTYSKAGHRIVIAANGDYQGLVSGGCLEGDLAERARRVLDERRALGVTYDLRDEADELFGLGIGCNGLIRVFLQPLFAETAYEPFASIAECLVGEREAAVATLIETRGEDAIAGGTLVRAGGETLRRWQVAEAALARLARGCDETLTSGTARYVVEPFGGVLYAPLKPVPRLLVLGAGLDAIPLVDLASDLGWLVTVADHRPGYIARGGFGHAVRALVVDPEALAETLELDSFDAVVVMSHHLGTDRKYLEVLADVDPGYLGVLGPPARKQRLLDELGETGHRLERLRGPVGLNIGADTPESIALSIVAELQAVFAGAARKVHG